MRVSYEALENIRERYQDKIIAYTNGCFDMLHRGHLERLKRLRGIGEIAVVGVTCDQKVRANKGPSRPIQDEETRIEVVDALRYVDYTLITPDTIPGYRFVGEGVLRVLRPNILLTSDSAWQQDTEWLDEQGTRLVMDDRPEGGPSTTATIEHLLRQHIH